MGILRKLIFFVILIFLSFLQSIIYCDTSEFMIGDTPILPIYFLGDSYHNDFYKNPSYSTNLSTQSFSISSGQAFYGYQILFCSYLIPIESAVIGIGYQTLSASDIPFTIKSSDSRPSIARYLTHSQDAVYLSYAMPLTKQVNWSAKISQFNESIDTFSSHLFRLDVGTSLLITDECRLGVFTKSLMSIPASTPNFGFEASFCTLDWGVGYMYDTPKHTFSAGLNLIPNRFSLESRMVSASNLKPQALSISPVIRLGDISFTYCYTHYFADDFSDDFHSFAFKYDFGSRIRLQKKRVYQYKY